MMWRILECALCIPYAHHAFIFMRVGGRVRLQIGDQQSGYVQAAAPPPAQAPPTRNPAARAAAAGRRKGPGGAGPPGLCLPAARHTA
jgi:hypothetical protein